jgi:cysteine-rich repeat protein
MSLKAGANGCAWLLVCLGPFVSSCASDGDHRGRLHMNVDDTSIDGTFEQDGMLVGFSVKAIGDDRVTIALDIDGIPLDIAVDLSAQTLVEDAHGGSFALAHRTILLGLRDAIGDQHPEVNDTLAGHLLVKVADRWAEAPIGRAMLRRDVSFAPQPEPAEAVKYGCGGDGVTCLPGTSGSSWAIFTHGGICDARSTPYGDSVCRGRCGAGCNWFDEDYTWDCLDHDVCLDYSNDCGDEFNDAADDWIATNAPLCWSGTSRSKPPAVQVCGNGITEVGEQCDDHNLVNGDTCEANCTTPRCGNAIPDVGEECEDGNVVAGDGCSPTCTAEMTHVVINEVDYDGPGTDVAEFIELHNGTPHAVDLSNMALVLANGSSGGTEYKRIALAGTLPAAGYLVVCPAGGAPGTCASGIAVAPGAMIVNFAAASNNVQNGAPDGIALVDLGQGTLVDAISYEGSVTAAVITGVATFNLVEGNVAAVADDGTFTDALARLPNGTDKNDAASDWARRAPTPGGPNL